MKLNETGSKRWRFGIHPIWIQGTITIAALMLSGTSWGAILGSVAMGMAIQAMMDMTP